MYSSNRRGGQWIATLSQYMILIRDINRSKTLQEKGLDRGMMKYNNKKMQK